MSAGLQVDDMTDRARTNEIGPRRHGQARFPYQGRGPFKPRPERILMICWYNPAGISTVPETIAYLQALSRFQITVINTFEHSYRPGPHQLAPDVDLDAFAGIIIHNTVTYSAENLFWIDTHTTRKLKDYDGVKILMKQDDNHEFRQVAHHVVETGYDLIFTCLPREAIPRLYPVDLTPHTRFERMLTGYVTPTLRALPRNGRQRSVDIGYRGSIQPLWFGRLCYEKRRIGAMVAQKLSGRSLRLDISSRWEDRLGGDAWFDFLGSCKATLGTESGASVFDLQGDLDARIQAIEAQLGPFRDDEDYAEAYLSRIVDLEGLIDYGQLSPRHFEAAACGTLQILYPGRYSGILIEGRHFTPLLPDGSNIEAVTSIVLDERRRTAFVDAAVEEVILNPANWIETFVDRVDDLIEKIGEEKGAIGRMARRVSPPARHVLGLSRQAGPVLVSSSRFGKAAAPQTRTHHIAAIGADEVVREAVASESIDWSIPAIGWRADAALAWSDPLALDPAALAVIQELHFVDALLQLPSDKFGALIAAPAEAPQREALRSWLRDLLVTTATLVSAGSRLRGVHTVVAEAFETLPAAIVLGALFRADVRYEATKASEHIDGVPEFERQFRTGLVHRIIDHLGQARKRTGARDDLRPVPLLVLPPAQAAPIRPDTVKPDASPQIDGMPERGATTPPRHTARHAIQARVAQTLSSFLQTRSRR